MIKRAILLLIAGSLTLCAQENLDLIPKPVSMQRAQGSFALSSHTAIAASKGAEGEAESLAERLDSLTGLKISTAGEPNISLQLQPELSGTLGTEGYELSVRPDGIVVKAATTAGLFYGGITLAQLTSSNSIPCVDITDYPRFAWRGMMLDCSRHFQPKAFIEKLLDLMALQKMNHFHWHLVDSEGWRLEIKKYPKLTEVSKDAPPSYPNEDPVATHGSPKYAYGRLHGGGYYTQDDVREIVAYAAARHISIMPEIEFPAHSMAALMAYPEFSTTGKPPGSTGNISADLYNVDDKSMQFLRDVLAETMSLFPGEYIHFGGDEAPKREWKASPFIQQKIKELGLPSEDALQSWLFEQMAEYVAKSGRRAVGWQEITKGGIPKSAIVMPWIGMKPGVDAANNGNDIIVALMHPNYFTSAETDSPRERFKLYWGVTLPAVYNQTFEYPGILPENAKHILGAQGEVWGERTREPSDVEYMAFPRSAALSEALWTPPAEKDFTDFSKRLEVMTRRWARYSPPVNYHFLMPPPIARWTPEFLTGTANTLDFPITASDNLAAVESGSCGVIFQYDHGPQGLGIQKVDLVADGKVIATDSHEGFTGNKRENNIYFLTYPAFHPSTNVSLRVTPKERITNSYGDVTLLTGDKVVLFSPGP